MVTNGLGECDDEKKCAAISETGRIKSSAVPDSTTCHPYNAVSNTNGDSVSAGGEVNPCTAQMQELSFDDHIEAFKTKTTWELFRALWILKMCSINFLVDNSLQMMNIIRRIFGRRFLSAIFKPTFYRQFVGGETQTEIQECVQKLKVSGIRPLLASTFEEDVGNSGRDSVYNHNLDKTLECIQMSSSLSDKKPMIQLKVSGLMNADLLVFLGGIYDKGDKQSLIMNLSRILTGEETELSLFNDIHEEQSQSIKNGLARLRKIGKAALDKGVNILVDAEYTYMNPALTWLTLSMMLAYNKVSPVIWNSYQCYLKDTVNRLEHDMHVVKKLGACFGVKLCRGAYMNQERNRAITMGYPDPVCETFGETTENYHRGLDVALNWICSSLDKRCDLMVATHNEDSVRYAIKRMMELGIDKQSGQVCFGQLLGMCDQITYPLATTGFEVYKCIPYGAIEEVLPYLARRAMENKTVIAGARKEKDLLSSEIHRRFVNTICCRRSRIANS